MTHSDASVNSLFSNRLEDACVRIDDCLDHIFAELPRHPLTDAMRHACSGGKRMRGFFVLESAALFDCPRAAAVRAAASIECMHAYSIVHDDLPCMDDDNIRRGMPTVHVKWDEATAVLAGSSLQALSLEILCDERTSPNAEIRAALAGALARAAGAAGMAFGQAMDIEAETSAQSWSLERICELQAHKTGKLISWSCQAGPILADCDPEPLSKYAEAVGSAYQIADDLLDALGDPSEVGKPLRKDAQANKATFVSALGVRKASQRAEDLVRMAISALDSFGDKAEVLRLAARYAIDRRR